MRRFRFEIVLAAVLLALYLAGSAWFSPGRPLQAQEIDAYLATLEQELPWPEEEKAAVLRHLRAWAEADDGHPVYMLNLMRFYPALRPLPEVADFSGTPQQANAHYEAHVMPLLFTRGAYPVYGGEPQGVLAGAQPSSNLITFDPLLDNWSRVLVVRYPSRRAFLDLLADPVYPQYVPYKAAALLVALTPLDGQVVLPDAGLAMGGTLLLVFLLIAWIRALRGGQG